MKLETFEIKLKHDGGNQKIKVTSLSGERGAIAQILAIERCPISAVLKVGKVTQNKKSN